MNEWHFGPMMSSLCEVAVAAQCFAFTLVCTESVLLCSNTDCCRLCAMTQGCMLQHVIGVAALRSVCLRLNTTGRTCTSGKPWCLAALASICPADCSSVPLTAASQRASQPSSPPLLLFSLTASCLKGTLCCWAGVCCSSKMPGPTDHP